MPLRIGANTNPKAENRFVGEIARPQVFSRAVSAAEVARLVQDDSGRMDRDAALVGYWKFDVRKKDTFVNDRGDHLPAKIVGPVAVVDSPHGKAIHLDGTGYLEVAADPRLDLAEGCTLAAWIRPGKLAPNGGRILDKGQVGTNNGYMIDVFPGDNLRWIVDRGVLSAGAGTLTGEWFHVAATIDAVGTLCMYVNGNRVSMTKHPVAPELVELDARTQRLRRLHERLLAIGLGDSYEASHARLAIRYAQTCAERLRSGTKGALTPLSPVSQDAADRSYLVTAFRLNQGLVKVLNGYEKSNDPQKRQIHQFWIATDPPRTK